MEAIMTWNLEERIKREIRRKGDKKEKKLILFRLSDSRVT